MDYSLTRTDTTEEWLLKTLCKQDAYIFPKTLLREGLFFYKYILQSDNNTTRTHSTEKIITGELG